MHRNEGWRTLLSGEHGLAETQKSIFDKIQIDKIPFKKLDKLRDRFGSGVDLPINTSEISTPPTFENKGMTYKQLAQYGTCFYRFSGEGNGVLVFCQTPDEFYSSDLLETASILGELFIEVMDSPEFEELIKAEHKELGAYTDLPTKRRIILDNIQTLLDVFRTLTYGENDIKRKHKLIEKLCSEKPKKRIVRKGETLLETTARAPFGFWAQTRGTVPVYFDEKPIRDELEFNHDFLKYVATGEIPFTRSTVFTLKRHGGCPALHKDFADLDLINRLGQQFVAIHKRLFIDKV